MINETDFLIKIWNDFFVLNHLIKQVSLEKNVFNFEISVRFEYLVDVYDIEENKQHVNDKKIVCIYGGLKTKDAVRAIVIEQAEEVKSIAMFSNPEVNLYLRKLDILMIQPSSQVTYKVN